MVWDVLKEDPVKTPSFIQKIKCKMFLHSWVKTCYSHELKDQHYDDGPIHIHIVGAKWFEWYCDACGYHGLFRDGILREKRVSFKKDGIKIMEEPHDR
jgi:hypothetical protein